MSPGLTVGAGGATRFPRVSGDEPIELMPLMKPWMFSPRERG